MALALVGAAGSVLGAAGSVLGAAGTVIYGVARVTEAIFGKKAPEIQKCRCNKAAQVKVSIELNDFGRHYLCCYHRGEENDCQYFEWIDPQIDDRVKEVINNFMRNVQSLESENGSLKSTNKKQKEKIKALESAVDGLKSELRLQKSSLKLTSRFLYVSLAMSMFLILGATVKPCLWGMDSKFTDYSCMKAT